MKKKSRRTFLQLATAGIALIFGVAWNKLTLGHIHQLKQKTKVFPFNKNKELTFIDDYIIITTNKSTKVFSAHCTHLGCIINETEKGQLVCPCHGSAYNLEGNAVKGPAYKNLELVSFEISSDETQIEIG